MNGTQEAAWREDNRRIPNGEQVQRVAKLALGRNKSVDFSGHRAAPVLLAAYMLRHQCGRRRWSVPASNAQVTMT
jgi:hypothetical protein